MLPATKQCSTSISLQLFPFLHQIFKHTLFRTPSQSTMNDSVPSFDLDAYASRYRGRGKIQRLRFIAERSPELAADALRLAVSESKRGRDSVLYRQLVGSCQSVTDEASCVLDEAWVQGVDQWASKQLDKLRQDLDENKQIENKEVSRQGHNDLGDFFYERGRLQQARGEYIKTRDYCTQPAHNVEMCLKVIVVSIEATYYSHVESHFLIADAVPDIDRHSPQLAKIRACAGLASLCCTDYAAAAAHLLRVATSPAEERVANLQREFGDVLALEDVVVYAALCALATLPRHELHRCVLAKAEFRALLELVPDVREMVVDFYHTRYTRCLQIMDRLRAELMLDMHLAAGKNHVDTLYTMIRRRAIVQYVAPFLTTDLGKMETVFRTTSLQLRQELLTLIDAGDIQCRIDTIHNALHSKHVHMRDNTVTSCMQQGRDALNEAEVTLLRMSMMKHGLEINASARHGQGQGQGQGPPMNRRGGSINSVVDTMFESHAHFRS